MKILGIIPARGGSKGIPKKNIKLLSGKPLIAYTIEAAMDSKLDRVIVSTDCDRIAEVSKKCGAEVFMRSSELAEDKTPTLPVLQDVVSRLDERYDAIMTLQPTSPLRTVDDIDRSIKLFSSDKGADSLVSVVELPHQCTPEKLMNLKGKYLTGSNKISQRQSIRTMYVRNGAAIYITRIENLDKYIFGGALLPFVMKKINSFDIDDMQDWDIVEAIFNSSKVNF
jgi:CMP-N,N'-diacetyllegionaminic acid synthase